ncbi:MAG: gamma-glutamyltransferase [Phycisphaerales bacterium]|nr:gamma-glutamyltransferase [Phycisphaerales bacterium]
MIRQLTLLAVAAVFLAGCAAHRAALEDRSVVGDGVVAADHSVASQAGADMLRRGGNAVDAAVAASFCLSIVRPESCGIGGGGFMLIYLADHCGAGPLSVVLDYREQAPGAVGPGFFEAIADKNASTVGATAVGVPGTVAGLLYALDRYGTLDREIVLTPAIRAAEDGFRADAHFMTAARKTIRWLEEEPARQERLAYLWRDVLREGHVKQGDVIRNPKQARALRLIAEHGSEAFYNGPIGQAVIETIQRDGGAMTAADLRSFRVTESTPLRGRFQDRTILTMPPPSSGGIAILQMLGILDRCWADFHDAEPNSAESIHLLAEVMKHAFADRAEWLGDARFVDVPVDRLLSAPYLDGRVELIDPNRTLEPEFYGTRAPQADDGGTSHVSVIDAAGNAVACTETINLYFGSKLGVEAFGFCLNNEMDDFLTVRGRANAFGLQQSQRNLPAPGKRPLSSMSPTIVLRDGEVDLVVGASGGPRIITSTLQVMLNVIMHGMGAAEAVAAARVHHQWLPNELRLEDGLDAPDLREALERRGHTIAPYPRPAAVQAVLRRGGRCEGVSDPRKGGRPAAGGG